MGRYIKNAELKTGSYSIRAPFAPGSVGPESPVNGLIKFNTTLNKMQYYTQGAWRNFAIEGKKEIVKDSFVGNGDSRTFGPMLKSYLPGEEIYMLVFIGNVFQNPGTAFTVLNDQITFTSTPGDLQPIIIIHGYGSILVPL
jgi:hypothetical protein